MEDFDRNDRLVSPEVNRGETEEMNLRPRTLEEYVGQEKVKQNLSVYMQAAVARGEDEGPVVLERADDARNKVEEDNRGRHRNSDVSETLESVGSVDLGGFVEVLRDVLESAEPENHAAADAP